MTVIETSVTIDLAETDDYVDDVPVEAWGEVDCSEPVREFDGRLYFDVNSVDLYEVYYRVDGRYVDISEWLSASESDRLKSKIARAFRDNPEFD